MTRRRWSIFALCAAAYFLSQFFRSANAVLARDLAEELALGAAQLGLMTSLFYASFSAAQLPLGQALDRFGARLVTPSLMLVGVAGSLLFASAHSFAALAMARMLIGVGMSGVFVGSVKLFSRWFPAARFASASGYLVAIGSLGALSAGAPLAWLNQAFGWRAVFVLGAGVIFAAAAALYLWTRDSPGDDGDAEAEDEEGGLLTVIRTVTFWRLALLDFFMVGGLLSLQGLWGGPFLLDVVGLGKVQAGSFLTMLSLGAFAGYIIAGRLADRFGSSRVVLAGGALFTLAQGGLVLLNAVPVRGLALFIFVVFGFSGAFNILLKAQARATFPLCLTGRAVTAVNLFGIGGAFVIQWVQGLVIDAFGRSADGTYPSEAYAAAFALAAFGAFLALLFYVSGAPLAKRAQLRRVLLRG